MKWSLPEEAQAEYQAYPNPATDVLNLVVDLNTNGLEQVVIYDMLCHQVYCRRIQFVQGRASLSVANLATGVYILKIGHQTIRIVKQ